MSEKTYGQGETPDHPHAAVIEGQLRQLGVLLDTWLWSVYDNGDVAVTMSLQDDRTSLRVWISEDRINVDVHVITVPFEVTMLTWILMENFGLEYKARAVQVDGEKVHIYVAANSPLEQLPQLAKLIWAGYDAALGWRGRIWQVEIPPAPEGVSA